MHPTPCTSVISQSLARDLRLLTGIMCVYWRRAHPSLLWEKPSSPPRVPQLMEGLIDLLITIMLLLFNALKDWPPWNAAFVSAEATMTQILPPRTAAPGVATPLLEKECASVPLL